MKSFLFFAVLFTSLLHADNKASVMLSAGGYSSSGAENRPKTADVEVKKGFGSKKYDIPLAEQIAVLKSHTNYLSLMEKHGINIEKEVDATYTEKPLADALKELLPKVPVKFDGVDPAVTIKSLKAEKARMTTVIQFLDDAAGVFFVFTEEGITVKAELPAEK
jgi:hypothetical protein